MHAALCVPMVIFYALIESVFGLNRIGGRIKDEIDGGDTLTWIIIAMPPRGPMPPVPANASETTKLLVRVR